MLDNWMWQLPVAYTLAAVHWDARRACKNFRVYSTSIAVHIGQMAAIRPSKSSKHTQKRDRARF